MKAFIIVLIVAVALFALYTFVCYKSLMLIVRRKRRPKKTKKPSYISDPESFNEQKKGYLEGIEWLEGKSFEAAEIESGDGLKLRGRFYRAEKSSVTVICAHGYLSTGLKEFAGAARFFIESGWNVLLIDQRSHGESEGKYIGFGTLEKDDLHRWCGYVSEKSGSAAKIILYGISMGAVTSINLCADNPPESVCGLVSDCAFGSAMSVIGSTMKSVKIPPWLFLPMISLLCRITAGYSFKQYITTEEIKKIKVPALFLQGERDQLIPEKTIRTLNDNCPGDKELLVIQNAKHAASYAEDKVGYEAAFRRLAEKALRRSE